MHACIHVHTCTYNGYVLIYMYMYMYVNMYIYMYM